MTGATYRAKNGSLSPAEIAAGLDDRFRLLRSRDPTRPPRHQTLHALVDWSYERLPDAERALLRRLAVFPAGCTLDGAAAVSGSPASTRPGLSAVWESLAQLAAKSLLVVETDADPGPAERSPSRFTMQGNDLDLGDLTLDGSLALPITPSGMSGTGGVMRRGTIHPELLHQYETLTNTYRQLDYQVGSGAVYAETVAQLKRMLALAE